MERFFLSVENVIYNDGCVNICYDDRLILILLVSLLTRLQLMSLNDFYRTANVYVRCSTNT